MRIILSTSRLGAIAAFVLTFALASPGRAQVAPLFPVPVASLTCEGGVSTLTIAWEPGEYGAWSFTNSFYGNVTGGPRVLTSPTTDTFIVPNGWFAQTSTFRLNQDPTDTSTGANQEHVSVLGDSCPFVSGLVATYDCESRTISVHIDAGSVRFVRLFDGPAIVPFASFGVGPFLPPVAAPLNLGPYAVAPTITTVRIVANINGALEEISVNTSDDACPGTLVIHKFYDADADGLQGPNEPNLPNWVFVINDLGGATVTTATTGPDGTVPTLLDAGTYAVTEQLPASTWHVTTGFLTQSAVVPGRGTATVTFGNICDWLSTPGGHTIGFWRNNNGQALLTAGDFATLTAFSLRNANGSDRDFLGSLASNKSALASWLQGANATNMAYMLSAQLTATQLSVAHGFTNANTLVQSGMTVAQLIAAAEAALAADGSTPTGDPNRVLQTELKDLLDAVNNGQTFFLGVSPVPCS